jgi:ribosomal protein S18 acetylase RimI-like enzyme
VISLTLKPVSSDDQASAIATLVSAFIADPVERWLFPQPSAYLTHFPAYWYLPWLGVDCARQASGLGSDLLEQCLMRVDVDHSPAFLETPNPRTVPFYERHGFRVTSISQAGGCPPVTSMLRPA